LYFKSLNMKLGFIGLGKLGLPIALNLLESGHELLVYNRTASKAAPLAEKGARICDTVAEVAKECRIVLSIVFDDTAVKEICDGQNGLLQQLAAGSIHVCLSTISPALATSLAEQHAEKQLHYLSAPVFGRPEAAAARQLNYALAGNAGIKEQVRSLLKESGGEVWDFGEEVQVANMVKLCGNFLIIAAAEAIRESTAAARASKVPVEDMWEMLNKSLFKSPLYEAYSTRILQTPPGAPGFFSSPIPLKDLILLSAHTTAMDQPLPLPVFLIEQLKK
jgi:3-hydroxyisobutyrate dehydrogenase-like beta-hydroxyacid dehydrogenase